MRFLSKRVHGVLDYIMGILLIASPWIFNFANEGPATNIPVILGIAVIVYSFFTNYEMGAVKMISMNTHLWLDGLSGLFLAVSPWLFNFDEYVYAPHLIFGIIEVVAALTTSTVPEYRKSDFFVDRKTEGDRKTERDRTRSTHDIS